MTSQKLIIPIDDNESTSGILCFPEGYKKENTIGIIIAHGAANSMEDALIVSIAEGLAKTGFLTLRFNFLYREKGKDSIDSQSTLVKTWVSVYNFFKEHSEFAPKQIIATGKSLGGRVLSQIVADEKISPRGIIFYGYPLHAPGKKDKIRDSHLYLIKTPMFFIEGTRDPFCDLDLLDNVLNKLNAPWNLEKIQNGDHSYKMPKSEAHKQQDIYNYIVDKSVEWLLKQ